jgi:hypothetical protein
MVYYTNNRKLDEHSVFFGEGGGGELLRLLDAFSGVPGRSILLVGKPCCLFARFSMCTAHNICALHTEVTVYHP